MTESLLEALEKRILLFDGAMGTEIQKLDPNPEDFPEEMIKAGLHLYGPGEESEDNPGYKGRAGIYQVMPISDDMKRLIIEEANAVVLADQAAKEGVWDIRRSGLQKVAGGITSLAEVNRVTVE